MTEDNRLLNAQAEIDKGQRSLLAADGLLSLGLCDDAMSRLYYAAFHLASAALLVFGVEAASHRALIGLFSLHLVKPGHVSADAGRKLASLMGLRHQADYNRHFLFDKAGARQERGEAHGVLDEIAAFLRKNGLVVTFTS